MKPIAIVALTLGGLGAALTALLALPSGAALRASLTAPSADAVLASLPAKPEQATPEKIALGRKLFFDPVLSKSRSVSCSSCHSPQAAFSDPGGLAISPGVDNRRGRRNAISLINAADRPALTWSGASPSLETQAMIPLTDHEEMDMSVGEVVGRLSADKRYTQMFSAAFGAAPTMQGTIKALASYERTLISRKSPYDAYQAGDASALTEQQVRGLDLFFGRADCFHCHTGRDFTDNLPHNNAVKLFNPDTGLAERTEKDEDVGKFITPSLRNVKMTAPYMHDGSFATLKDVVEHYNDGGQPNPNTDPLIRPLGLSEVEVDDLLAFLQSLDDPTIAGNAAFAPPSADAELASNKDKNAR